MMPPPKPETVEETDCCAVANGPRLASRAATVGASPRSYGLAACAALAPVREPATRVRVTAAVTNNRRARWRAGMDGDCTSDSPQVGRDRRTSVFGGRSSGHIGETTGLDREGSGPLSVTGR
nr:hypothetical protein GCM10020092_047370 [Actinoplanes digitatis]